MTSALTRPDLKALKHAFRIEEILRERGLLRGFRRSGDRLTGPCPLHNGDNKDAFVILVSQNRWRCFTRCDTSGDVLDVLAVLDGVGPYEAARGLLSRPIRNAPAPEPVPAPPSFVPFTRALPLEHDLPFLNRKGIEPRTARLFEVGLTHHSQWLSGFVALRLHDKDGHPLGYAGRRLVPTADQPKWRFPPGLPKSSLLYGFHRLARVPDALVVVECPWAVMRLYQLGIPAVALLGLHLSGFQEQILRPIPRLVLLLDGDTAGRLAQARLGERLSAAHDVASKALPDGKDPDELSDEALRGLLGREGL